MPHEGNLYDFLAVIDLQQYHHDFVNKLGVTTVEHAAYVQSDDVLNLGMTAPEWRRLRASMKKVKKGKLMSVKDKIKGTKQKPTIVRLQKDGVPTGGHIIPSTAIQITDRELGRGEFGRVMQGIWTNDNGQKVQVAVKCLSPEKLAADKSQQDFLKEAAIMHAVNHVHLVKLYGVVLDMDASLVLVTEFAPLRSLCENLKQPALRISFPVNLLLDFTMQIAEAMRYLHLSNIIHRDLATRNILLFVDDEGVKKVKISDFGLSRRLMIGGDNYTSEMRPNLKLPLAWMPVEALTKLTFTKASDVWSFGVTMWEMFSYGCQPWATKSGEEILRAIDKPKLQRLSKPEACTTHVYDLILKCWRHEPDARPTFAEICEELPTMKPIQVRAISNYKATREEEISYRSEDIITVLDSNDDTGVWRGATADGHIGLFHRSNTTLVGSSGGSKLRRWKSGSKGSNKAENRKRFGGSESPKTPQRSPSKLTALDISTPSEYKHVFHVGYDGRVQGDPTFGGDYRSLPAEGGDSPSKSSEQWSSADSTSSRSNSSTPHRSPSSTPSKSPTFPSVSIQPRTHPMLSNEPPCTTSSQPELRAGIPVASPRVRLAEDEKWDLEGSSCSLADDDRSEEGVASAEGATATSPDDELSSLDFGSLLDDVMTAWDATRTSVGIDQPQQANEDLEDSPPIEGANGTTSGRSSPSLSVGDDDDDDYSYGASNSTLVSSHQTQGITVMVGKDNDTTLVSSSHEGAGSLDSLPPLHNAITKDMPSNPVKTYRKVSSSGHQSDTSSVGSFQSYPSAKETGEADRFGGLSSTASDSADNEYVDEARSTPDVNGNAYSTSAVNGHHATSHISHEDRMDEILDADDYDESPVSNRVCAAEIESASADVSFSSELRSQASKTSDDSDFDDDRLRLITRNSDLRGSASSSGAEANERLVGNDNGVAKPRSPSTTKSPRRPKGPPPKGPPPKGPPPVKPLAKPKGPPPPVPPAPWAKKPEISPKPSKRQLARKAEEEEDFSFSALRQKFASANSKPSSETNPRAGVARSGSYKESISAQASVGRSNSTGGYDSSASEQEVKLSDRTLENLERTMPRRTRGKNRRRSSEEASESDRSSVLSSRASEGDSSSDEGAVSKPTTAYTAVACPLPELPEDQTNYNPSSATQNPLPLPPRKSPKVPLRQAQINTESPPEQVPELKPRLVRQGNTGRTGVGSSRPGISVSEDDTRQRRSKSFDSGVMLGTQPREETDQLRQQRRHSFDILDNEGSHISASPEQIRELLAVNNDNSDMPSRTPPPIPRRLPNRLQHSQSEDMSKASQIPRPGKTRRRVKGQDYEFMSPQANGSVQLSPLNEQQNQDSDSGVDSPQLRHTGMLLSENNNLGLSEPNIASVNTLKYVRMSSGSPSLIRRDLDLGEGKFSRSRSAHTINWPRQQQPNQPSSSHPPPPPAAQKYKWEDVTTVARSKFKQDGGERTRGRRTLQKNSRMSRSVDDLLSAGRSNAECGGLVEAESLRDILSRTYAVPSSGGSSSPVSDQAAIYLTPRSWKTTQNTNPPEESNLRHPSAPSNAVHPSAPPPPPPHESPNLSSTPPPIPLHRHLKTNPNDDPGYIDMRSPEKCPGAPFRPGMSSDNTAPQRPISAAYISADLHSKPRSYSRTIPEEEEPPSSEETTMSGGDNRISINLQSRQTYSPRTSLFKEENIEPSKQTHVYSTPPVESSQSEYAVPLRQKSSGSHSKELYSRPPSRPTSQTIPVRPERSVSLTKSLSQEIPLPRKNRHIRFDSEEGAGTYESSESVETSRGIEARRLKEQLPDQISMKSCLEALTEADGNSTIAKQQLLIGHLATTLSVEASMCESALKQSRWNLQEAMDVVNSASEVTVCL